MKVKTNQNGFTLIEVLASFTLLTFIFLSFSYFFINTYKYNAMSNEDLKGINLAQQKLAEIKSLKADLGSTSSYEIEETINGVTYLFKISIENSPESYKNSSGVQVELPIHFLMVEAIDKEGNKSLSKAYGYYETDE